MPRDTYNLDVSDLERRLTPATRAIIVVHAFGLPADMDPIMDLAQRHRSGGDRRRGVRPGRALSRKNGDRFAGTIGDLGCFSFHPRKSITTGEGGMIVTDDEALAEPHRVAAQPWRRRGEYYYEFEAAGFNYRLSDLQAAVGVAQMGKFQWVLERKRALAAQLTARWPAVKGVTPPLEPPTACIPISRMWSVLDDGLDRDRLIAAMRRHDIETTLGHLCLARSALLLPHIWLRARRLTRFVQDFPAKPDLAALPTDGPHRPRTGRGGPWLLPSRKLREI